MHRFLNNLRVAVRLPFVPTLALISLIVFAVGAFTTLKAVEIGGPTDAQIAEHNLMLADIVPPTASLAPIDLWVMEAKDALRNGDNAGADAAVEQIKIFEAAFRERHQYWQEHATGTELELFDAIRQPGDQYLQVLEGQFLPAVAARDIAAVDAADSALMPLVEQQDAAVENAATELTAMTEQMTSDAEGLVSSRENLLYALLAVTMVVVGAAAWLVTRSVLKPLDELRRNMDEIASGDEGSKHQRLDADRRDEFGHFAMSFNAFADQLVAYSAESEANARIAHARAIEVSQAANVAAENMNTVAVATTELSAAASEIARSAGDASRTAETAVQAADHANALMERLADSSARIGEVVESIRGIAAQTTMLALNATIEAARAGEAGRGFAVVASEVKDLAAETGSATADIVNRVEAIHADTQAALVALNEVAHVITEISSSQSVIAAAVEEQAATTAEIDRSLTEAVTAVNQLAGTNHAVHVDEEMARAAVAAAVSGGHHFTTAA